MLEEMLEELNTQLEERNRNIVLHLVGGYALELKGIRVGVQTEDIDPINTIDEDDVIEEIHKIGERLGNAKWFDFSASSLTVPRGYEKRLTEINKYSNIDLRVLSNADLVKMKIAAYHGRRDRGIYRDLEDLERIKPTLSEIQEGVKFYFEEYSKELPAKFKKDFKK